MTYDVVDFYVPLICKSNFKLLPRKSAEWLSTIMELRANHQMWIWLGILKEPFLRILLFTHLKPL